MILTLSVILFILIAVIGRGKGIKTFFSAYVNFFLLVLSAVLIVTGMNPIAAGLIFSILFSMITLFWVNGYNHKTLASFLSILLVLALIGFFTWWLGAKSHITGFPRVLRRDRRGGYHLLQCPRQFLRRVYLSYAHGAYRDHHRCGAGRRHHRQ